MIIELQGAWLKNLGAAQMFDAASTEIRDRHPDWKLALNRVSGEPTGDAIADLRVWPAAGRRGIPMCAAFDVVRRVSPGLAQRVASQFESIGLGSADALLDISGFALSDQWARWKVDQRAQSVERFSNQGKPVVLMPQAIGPLANADTRSAVTRVIEASDLVFIRDDHSMALVTELVGTMTKVRRSPDLTIGLPAKSKPPRDLAGTVAIVPNERMCDQGGMTEADYLAGLEVCIDIAIDAGLEAVPLVHSRGAGDIRLANLLSSRKDLAEPVIEDDPRALKAAIRTSEAVVGSRFHALLGALGQGVPVLAIGWSHKYRQLLSDFQSDQWNIDPAHFEPSHFEAVRSLASDFFAAVLSGSESERLMPIAAQQRAALTETWSACFEVLEAAAK